MPDKKNTKASWANLENSIDKTALLKLKKDLVKMESFLKVQKKSMEEFVQQFKEYEVKK
jgi:hypothetical protein